MTDIDDMTDERRKLAAELERLYYETTIACGADYLALYDRGYADGQADLLTKISGEITHPAAASDLPRGISHEEMEALPHGAVYETIITTTYRVDDPYALEQTVTRRLISLPDPDQRYIDVLAASGLTEAQARDALDAITAIAVIKPRAE